MIDSSKLSITGIEDRIHELRQELADKTKKREEYKRTNAGTKYWYRSSTYSNLTSRMYHIRQELKELEARLNERKHKRTDPIRANTDAAACP